MWVVAMWMMAGSSVFAQSEQKAEAALAGVNAKLTLLDGSSRAGEIRALTADGLDLVTTQGEEHVAADDLMQVELTPSATSEEKPLSISVRFADKSVLLLSRFESDGTKAKVVTPEIPELSVPVRQVTDVRFAPLDDQVAEAWEDLRSRNARDDLLVIRKGEVLDYVAGSIGKVTSQAIVILVRGKELSAPRERVFGLIYASREAAPQKRRVAVETGTGDLLQAESLLLKEGLLQITTASLGNVSIPITSVRSMDYGGGRIRFLADLPFDQSNSKSPNENDPVVWFVCRNAPSGSGGKAALSIGTQEFRHGLWLHSGAVLRYRLNREYSQLRATAGFELTHVTRMPRFDPSVRLVISGDGQEIYAKEFRWNDPPELLDLKLKDVRELTIQVESAGSRKGILEHFALGDAQVIQ